MPGVKLTKNSLKQQKDALKRYLRYLPTLQLKKQQLQMMIRQVESKIEDKSAELERLKTAMNDWIAVFGEDIALDSYLKIDSIEKDLGNIAGVDIPVFKDITFTETDYDFLATPLWVDRALDILKEIIILDAEIIVLREQADLLGEELRITSQRVNLFEKVKIPEAKENIRIISIYLGDQQTAAVVRGKIAKNKYVKVS
jgi:V/A-type H+/Na+-transporting ATPase subunit D